jgi:uncharacterized protein (DUF433 family)
MHKPLAEPQTNPIHLVPRRDASELAAHTTVDPDIRGGEPCITGTRVPVAEVAALLADGVPTDRIGEIYPTVAKACGWDIREETSE